MAEVSVSEDNAVDVGSLSDADLEERLVGLASEIFAAEARFLVLLAEFDRRERWGIGILSAAHWLSWRCGLSLRTGREYVRVARALRVLPLTAAGFAAGRLSYSQVRAITRVATAEDEVRWVELARVATGSQLERLARGVARARRAEPDAVDVEEAAYRLRTTVRYDPDGTMAITVRLRAEDGAVLLVAIDAARDNLQRREEQQQAGGCGQPGSAEPRPTSSIGAGPVAGPAPDADAEADVDADGDADAASPVEPAAAACGEAGSAGPFPRPLLPCGQRVGPSRTEAVLHLARHYLDGGGRAGKPRLSRRSRARLQLLVDPLSGWARLPEGELLPAPCTAPLLRDMHGWGLRPLTGLDLTARDLGRSAREPDRALRELLGQVDGERCRFPGCTRTRKLHAHHLRHWAHGGRTDLVNMILLCGRHHTLVHRDGYRLTLHPDRTLDVSTVDGRPIPHRPLLPWADPHGLDPAKRIDQTTLPPNVTDGRLDLHHAVFVLTQHAA